MSFLSPSGSTSPIGSVRGRVVRKPVSKSAPKSKSSKARTLALTPLSAPAADLPPTILEKAEVQVPFKASYKNAGGTHSIVLELGGILRGLIVELDGNLPAVTGAEIREHLQLVNGERFEFKGNRPNGISLPALHRITMSALRKISPSAECAPKESSIDIPIAELEATFKEISSETRVKVLGKTTSILISLADGIYSQTNRSVPAVEVNRRSLALRRQADARLLFVATEQSEQNRLLEEAVTFLERAHKINSREPSIRMKLASVLIESVSKTSKMPGDTLRNKKTALPYLRRLFDATRLLDEFKAAQPTSNASPDFCVQLKEVLDILRNRIQEAPHLFHPVFHAYSALVEIWFPKHPQAMQLPGKLILSTLLKEHRIRGVFQSLLSIFEHDEGYNGELATLDMALRLPRIRGVKVLGVNIPIRGAWGVVQECSIHSTDIDLVMHLSPENDLGLEAGIYWVEVKKRQSCRTIQEFCRALESNDKKLSTQLITQQLWCSTLSERYGCQIKRLMIWCGPDCPNTRIEFKSYQDMEAFPPIALCRTSSVTSDSPNNYLPFPSLEAFNWTIGPGGINRPMANILQTPLPCKKSTI
jgi:hypothetical protein